MINSLLCPPLSGDIWFLFLQEGLGRYLMNPSFRKRNQISPPQSRVITYNERYGLRLTDSYLLDYLTNERFSPFTFRTREEVALVPFTVSRHGYNQDRTTPKIVPINQILILWLGIKCQIVRTGNQFLTLSDSMILSNSWNLHWSWTHYSHF